MTDLRTRIIDAIRINGPMPVSLYMLMCLHDPRAGYYATRPALNVDFTTAPETSQVFGELIGLWAAHEWMALGKPTPFHLIELGPGRGAMMADALRAAASVPRLPRRSPDRARRSQPGLARGTVRAPRPLQPATV